MRRGTPAQDNLFAPAPASDGEGTGAQGATGPGADGVAHLSCSPSTSLLGGRAGSWRPAASCPGFYVSGPDEDIVLMKAELEIKLRLREQDL